ncbi:ankyrin repeat-containing domain protein [Mycena galericulata]|nr:ankyrin repeat-containing domain protein [Mycena galericulata]
MWLYISSAYVPGARLNSIVLHDQASVTLHGLRVYGSFESAKKYRLETSSVVYITHSYHVHKYKSSLHPKSNFASALVHRSSPYPANSSSPILSESPTERKHHGAVVVHIQDEEQASKLDKMTNHDEPLPEGEADLEEGDQLMAWFSDEEDEPEQNITKSRHSGERSSEGIGPSMWFKLTSRSALIMCRRQTAQEKEVGLSVRCYSAGNGRVSSVRLPYRAITGHQTSVVLWLSIEIHLKITSSVDGMFLLAKLHIESLCTKSNVKQVREALKSLPKTLNDSYEHAMKRIEEQNQEDRQLAHSTLTWVANTKRPLTALELQTALAIEPDTQSLDEDNIFAIEIILSVCAGLVIVDEQLSVVRLVHYTVQEYLDSIQPRQFPNAQTEIACSLFMFLAFGSISDLKNDSDRGLPSLLYYAQYCLAHASGPPENALKDLILKFLAGVAQERTLPQKKYDRHGSLWHSQPWDYPDWPSTPSPLWIATAANLLEITKFLLTQEQFQNSDSYEIIVASYYGHLHMVQLLVEHGANVDAQDGRYGTALQAAAEQGHEDIVGLLIEHGVNVNAEGGEYGTAMQAAADGGHEDIVQLLIEHGANVNAQGGRYGTALQAAADSGHEDIVRHLIDHGADVNAQVGRYGTALQAAADSGHEGIVRFLIEHGSNVDTQGGRYGTALQAAANSGHEDIVQLLIEHGANINAQGGRYGTALQAAADRGHEDIVHLLIEHGANVNAQGGEYVTALQATADNGHKDIVRLLIEHGANGDPQGGEYGTALQAAADRGHEDIVRLLIKRGVDVNAEGGTYGTALQAAADSGHEDIIRILIEHGANVNAQGGRYGTALQAAADSGHEDIIQLLIEHGANVNAEGGMYGTALQAAADSGHEDVVQLLIEHSANVNAQGGRYGTALQAAADSGHEDIVQLLIEHGANVNAQGGRYGTALQAAADSGHEDIVRLLIEHGANVNAQVGRYGTALQAASYSGQESIVQLLIEHGAIWSDAHKEEEATVI